ncbi:MAG: hypothetical protein IAI49_08400 [Candidatus Eremiobacteraeota bacterium]|nr:hypothetical protein [Candidatus Eremiobacteraeota bacterium]
MTGEAPWALSAVPECFHQTANLIGSGAFARAHIPAGVAGPLRYGERCAVCRGDKPESATTTASANKTTIAAGA